MFYQSISTAIPALYHKTLELCTKYNSGNIIQIPAAYQSISTVILVLYHKTSVLCTRQSSINVTQITGVLPEYLNRHSGLIP